MFQHFFVIHAPGNKTSRIWLIFLVRLLEFESIDEAFERILQCARQFVQLLAKFLGVLCICSSPPGLNLTWTGTGPAQADTCTLSEALAEAVQLGPLVASFAASAD